MDSRIPPCCGRRLKGPISNATKDYKIVSCPLEIDSLLPNLPKHIAAVADEVYVCEKCHKAYNFAIFDAFESLCYEIDSCEGTF